MEVGNAGPRECPLWVKSRHERMSASCPLYPRKRTSEPACTPQSAAIRQSIDLVCVVRSDIAGDLGAFFHIAADDDVGRRRANVIGLFKTAIAAIEARDHLLAAVSARRFGIDQGLRLAPPFLAFAAVADAAQEMQRAQNFRQPLQVAIIGQRLILHGRILRGRLRRPRSLRRRFVCRVSPHSMVRRAPTITPAVAPVIAPELGPRRPRNETKRERNRDAYANGWHDRYYNPD